MRGLINGNSQKNLLSPCVWLILINTLNMSLCHAWLRSSTTFGVCRTYEGYTVSSYCNGIVIGIIQPVILARKALKVVRWLATSSLFSPFTILVPEISDFAQNQDSRCFSSHFCFSFRYHLVCFCILLMHKLSGGEANRPISRRSSRSSPLSLSTSSDWAQ